MANLKRVLNQLGAEQQRLQKQLEQVTSAIAALGSLDGRRRKVGRRGRPASRPVRHMSVAARRRIGAAQKARWAKLRAQRLKRAGK